MQLQEIILTESLWKIEYATPTHVIILILAIPQDTPKVLLHAIRC